MIKYSSAIIPGMNQIEAVLDQYGADGWELVTTTQLFYEQPVSIQLANSSMGMKPGPILMVFKKEELATPTDPEETEDANTYKS